MQNIQFLVNSCVILYHTVGIILTFPAQSSGGGRRWDQSPPLLKVIHDCRFRWFGSPLVKFVAM